MTAALVERAIPLIEAARDPERAASMAAYMKGQFAYAGIPSPGLTRIYREAVAGLPAPAGDADLALVAGDCWALPEREYQYLAVRHLQRHTRRLSPAFAPELECLITRRSWWDTVDALATDVTGALVGAHPELTATMDRWLEAGNMWLARAAILHQERWRERTDADRLFRYCLQRAGDREFFIRKAIGWALRSYAKAEPEPVASFLVRHGDRLSGLSVREAERGVAMGRQRRATARVAGA